MALMKIYKGTALSTTKVPVRDGQLLFETDTKKIWMDNGNARILMGQALEKAVTSNFVGTQWNYSASDNTFYGFLTDDNNIRYQISANAERGVRFLTRDADGNWTAHVQPILGGGTGATTALGASYNILKDTKSATDAMGDGTMIVFKYASPSETSGAFYTRTATYLKDYIRKSFLSLAGGTMTGSIESRKTSQALTIGTSAKPILTAISMGTNEPGTRMYFTHYDQNSSYYDNFVLPGTSDLTKNGNYWILTTKSAVTVAQGGTGGTTAAAAMSNLKGRQIFTSYTQLGLTKASACYEIWAALPNNSSFIAQNSNNSQVTDGPSKWGVVQITKASSTYGVGYYSTINTTPQKFYFATFYEGRTFDGWEDIVYVSNNKYLTAYSGTGTGGIGLSDSGFWIRVQRDGANSEYLYMTKDGKKVYTYDTTGEYVSTLLSSINYSDYALPLTGGTITGALYRRGANGSIGFAIGTANVPECISILLNRTEESGSNGFGFRQYGSNGYRENFNLPRTTEPEANTNYSILTTKNLVTIAQGGTDATTALGASYNILKDTKTATDAVGDGTIMVFKYSSPTASTGAFYTRTASYFKTYIGKSFLPLTGGTLTGALTGTNITASGTIKAGANLHVYRDSYPSIYLKSANETELARIYMGTSAGNYSNLYLRVYKDASTTYDAILKTDGSFTANKVLGAVWNDYAEYRSTVEDVKPGQVICENGDGTLSISTKRMQPGCEVVSDTFGFAIGETENHKTPIACAGRVLVYTYQDKNKYTPGAPVCSGPNGTIDIMTREEIVTYPECIVGYVSEIPTYETWGTDKDPVNVDGRIWIKVK